MTVKPKKYFGQHFLKDPATAQKIVDAIPSEARQVLEIGPGKGILTEPLIAQFGQHLKVVEIDYQSIDHLLLELPQLRESNIIQGDFLKHSADAYFKGDYHLVGNFPYNISSQILFWMLEYRHRIPSMTGMFQKEVAMRIASEPGSRVYGILSVLTQAFYKAEIIFTLSRDEFYPPPKVQSAVIRLIRRDDYHLDCDEQLFFKVVKTAFQQRRKTLRNSLKGLLQGRQLPERLISERPEQLGVADFVQITHIVRQLPE